MFEQAKKHLQGNEIIKKEIEDEVQKHYGKQTADRQDSERRYLTSEKTNEISYRFFIDAFKNGFVSKETKEMIISEETKNILVSFERLSATDRCTIVDLEANILEYFLRGKIKPNISEQIQIKELESGYDKSQIASSVKKLLDKQMRNK